MSLPHPPDAAQADYTFVQIDPLGVGHCYVDAHALNSERMVIVYWYDDCDNWSDPHNSLWNNGTWKSVDWVDPNCPDAGTQFDVLTNRGIAFGLYFSALCTYQRAAGLDVRTHKWFVLPYPEGFTFNNGMGMSDNGFATGLASNDYWFSSLSHWIWDGKRYIFPTYPANWDVSQAWSGPEFINNAGQIAGQFVDTPSGLMRGYFQHGATVIAFDAPGAPYGTYVNGITNAGDVLLNGGYDETSPYYPTRSFAWRHGVFTVLPNVPYPDAMLTYVFGLNERGDLSGAWEDINGLMHAFIALRNPPQHH
jgi:hypothetical protein